MDSRKTLGDELNQFIEEYVDSFVKWDLVTFFSFNPDAAGTADDLAGRLGRKTEDISDALANLTARKLLSQGDDAGQKVYSFQPSPELRERVTGFCEALENRDKRLEILAKLLRMKATH